MNITKPYHRYTEYVQANLSLEEARALHNIVMLWDKANPNSKYEPVAAEFMAQIERLHSY